MNERSWPPYFFGQVIPIQPRSPTLRENAGTSVSSRLGLNGVKVPAAISSARKARTSRRSSSHLGGRRIGSKRSAAVISRHPFSARGHQRPQFVGAAAGDTLAQLDRPMALRAKIVAPGQRTQGVAVQDVLDGEADRAVHLMRNRAALFGGFRTADLRRDRFEEHGIALEGGAVAERVRRRSGGGERSGRLAGEAGEV